MLELIPNLPDNVLGIRAEGKVTAEDYQSVLVPAVEARLGKIRKLRLLYVLGDEFEEFTGPAAWEDAKVGMRHFTAFERIAVVTEVDWIARMVKAFGFVLPGDVRIYDNDDYDDALSWIGAPPSPGKLEFELLTGQSVLVLRPQGELEAADFKRVATEVDPYIDRVGGLSGIVVVAHEFPGWDDYAAFSAHFRFIREHQSKIRRVAIVTGSRFLSAVPKLANLFLHAETRKFDSGETEAAIGWAARG